MGRSVCVYCFCVFVGVVSIDVCLCVYMCRCVPVRVCISVCLYVYLCVFREPQSGESEA